ncbi:MAG TPA: ROK family protein [Terracidiphilus sp.]|jgi:predicted NBD/HSP70 family sugar kinase|nr:ROK family protein [Terracidiphilus sp.]
MANAIGLVMTEHIVAGRLEEHKLVGTPQRFPVDTDEVDALTAIPSGELVEILASHVTSLAAEGGKQVDAIGVAVPGVVRHNIVEDSPNLNQIKGMHLGDELARVLAARGISAPVHIANDADAIAAGVAATRGHLNRLTRVWTIGNGIGYGRWPYVEGVWEGGHITVTLDPKERFCGCGGAGHLEGIMGYRAMRLRFLDKEPEEVFAGARQGDAKCREFVDLWHRALAAATASFIHLAGPGRFYFTGHNVGFLELPLLRSHLETMVKMSPLQSFSLEVLQPDDETALIGAGVSAVRALTW